MVHFMSLRSRFCWNKDGLGKLLDETKKPLFPGKRFSRKPVSAEVLR